LKVETKTKAIIFLQQL